MYSQAPLVVVVGPTGSGKTGLAIKLAKKYSGEVISADSRAIYKTLDIGTAKPSKNDQDGVPHWGIDLVDPDTDFSVAEFKDYANRMIQEIRARNKVPFLVGGSGLYIDAVIFNYTFGAPADISYRQELQALSLEGLYKYCENNNIKLPENYKNKRYVIRAIENSSAKNNKNNTIDKNTILVGIETDGDELELRLTQRVQQMLASGLVHEAQQLYAKWPLAKEAQTGNAYRVIRDYLAGEFGDAELVNRLVALDKKLVKKQRTWFKRNKAIKWGSRDEVYDYLDSLLANYRNA